MVGIKKKVKYNKGTILTLKILMSISALFYLILFFQEIKPPYDGGIIGGFFIVYLFIIFLTGYYFTMKKDFFASGVFIILWYVLMIVAVNWIWKDAGTVLALGFPVSIFGLIMFILSLIKKGFYKNKNSKK